MTLNPKNAQQPFVSNRNVDSGGVQNRKATANKKQADQEFFPFLERDSSTRGRCDKKSVTIVKIHRRQSKSLLQPEQPLRDKNKEKLQLPSLGNATTASNAKSTKESWVTKLGLRESFEIPRSVLKNLQDDILRIDRQLREEEKIQEIRIRRPNHQKAPADHLTFHSKLKCEHTHTRPDFSYFPRLARSQDWNLGFCAEPEETKRIKRRNRKPRKKTTREDKVYAG